MRFARSIAQRNIPQNHLFIRRNCPLGHLEQSLRLYLERPLAALVLFIGRRYYLRPIINPTAKAVGFPISTQHPLRPFGTEPLALPGTPSGLLEQSLRIYLERALAQMERPLGSWNALGALGTPLGFWNRASGSIWNARSAFGTPLGPWNRASGSPETAPWGA